MKVKLLAAVAGAGLCFTGSASAIMISQTGDTMGGTPGGGPLYQAEISTADVGDAFTLDYNYLSDTDSLSASTTFTIGSFSYDGSNTLFSLGVSLSNNSGTDMSTPFITSLAFNIDPNMNLTGLSDSSSTDTDALTGHEQYTNFPGLHTVDVCVFSAGCSGGNVNLGLAPGETDMFVLDFMAEGDLTDGSLILSDFALKFQGVNSYQLPGSYCTDGNCEPPTQVPAPAPLALMGLGLLGMAGMRRRRKQA